VKYAQQLSVRAVKDLDALDDKTKKRSPPWLVSLIENFGSYGWRIVFLVDGTAKTLFVVTIERRGQVYKRL
jgi:mRNA-degrading endonuclease RelE of RelBE toxin-antitoxin system